MTEQFPDGLVVSEAVLFSPGSTECTDEQMATYDAIAAQRRLTLEELNNGCMHGWLERGRMSDVVAALEPYATGADIQEAATATHWLAMFVYGKGSPMSSADSWMRCRLLSVKSSNLGIVEMATDALAEFYYCKGDLDTSARWYELLVGDNGKPGKVSEKLDDFDHQCTAEWAGEFGKYLRATGQHERASDWFAFALQESDNDDGRHSD
jgi:hypothetical protein